MATFTETTPSISPFGSELDRSSYIPTNLAQQGLLSLTNHAYDCFVKQKFSLELQKYLINYVMSVTSYYSVYK